ncbi:hypothetical protein GTP23_12685 [Pseudoduganella sp. FT93W]|uniref:Uncharacterized protein n=1 Tax=Duganella fentianensis TaxID=2692177 RepID=A0A845HWX7_9BURK|nr:hypothetical protein [Duganella fentianensis]MYN45904.1 hypothetical protein [Duganella fentianensis]
MTLIEIKDALSRAQKGILQYTELMRLFAMVDVSDDAKFQRAYNAFYRVQRRQESWYRGYYSLMQSLKGKNSTFSDILDEIYRLTGRYEPSFASKLLATIDPSKPVWDRFVLENSGHKAPSYSHKEKFELAKKVYASLEKWYSEFVDSADGQNCIAEFDRTVVSDFCFTDVKKVDFILWQTRK